MKTGTLRFVVDTWIISTAGREFKFKSSYDLVGFCNREQIKIANKDILFDKHRRLLEM